MTIFLSDIHLGWGDKADDFSSHAKRTFLRMQREYLGSPVVVVGDLFDTDNHLERTLKNNHAVVGSIGCIVPGNHDGDISWLRSFGCKVLPLESVVYLAGKRTLLTHGHQYDPYNKPDVSIGKKITRIVSFLERHIDEDIDEKLVKLRHVVNDSLGAYEASLILRAKELDSSQAIYGHVHQPYIKEVYGIRVANCGTWTKRFEQGYPVIIADDKLELKWVNDGGRIVG